MTSKRSRPGARTLPLSTDDLVAMQGVRRAIIDQEPPWVGKCKGGSGLDRETYR